MSAKDGVWNEQLKSDRAFVTALKNISLLQVFWQTMVLRSAGLMLLLFRVNLLNLRTKQNQKSLPKLRS